MPIVVQSIQPTINYKVGLNAAKNKVVSQFERQAIHHYLSKAKGNVTHAAALAKMPRRSFYRLLEKYSIDTNSFKDK